MKVQTKRNMRFLVSTKLESFRAVTNPQCPHIDFCDPNSDLSIPLASQTVDVWICDGEEVTRELMDWWLGDHACQIPKSMLVREKAIIPRLQGYANGRLVEIAGFPEQKQSALSFEESVLRDAETLYIRARALNGVRQLSVTSHPERNLTSVLLVGAGIMNLMTAEFLASRGYQVRVVDAGPNPQSCKDWTKFGVTNGGGNARMYTRTEADNYNEKGSQIYQNMRSIFRQTARNGGWSVKSPSDFNAFELAWVDAFERVPAWLARKFRDDIHEVNREAGELWEEQLKSSPQLFRDVEFRKDILRFYVEPNALDAAIRLNDKLGVTLQENALEELLTSNPDLRTAAAMDQLAGCIKVEGFTLNIRPFVAKLQDRIIELGGNFIWNCPVQAIPRNGQGQVTVLQSELGPLVADHYVLSPGVTGNGLLKGTACENLIQGVLGVWLRIPNLHPQVQHSIKIHRRGHLVEDSNVTIGKDQKTGEDYLMFGGGYGYVGLERPAPDNPELIALFNELEEVARIYFPRGYAQAKERGSLYPGGSRKFCIRPFTPTGLGVFERIPTATGGQLIITGGNNTGGFAQAPAIARAVWRSFTDQDDPIHELFHPDRGRISSIAPSSAPPTATLASSNAVTYKCRFPEPLSFRDTQARPPLKLLLLCSDGPQHSYLRYCLDQAFPGYRCIVETDEGQVRKLVDKGRMVDAFFMKYHGLRRRLFGDSDQRKAYFNDLIPQNHISPTPDLTIDSVNCRKVWEAVDQWQPEFTIVSGTKFIGRKLNERAGLMINLHIGHLPEYKGNHCIFFALHYGEVDKVSATLHQLTQSLDGGDILERVIPPVLPSDNEEALYNRCLHMAIDRCVKRAEQFSRGERLEFATQEFTGRTFRHRDRTPVKELWLWWKIKVSGLLYSYMGSMAAQAGKSLE